MLDSPCGSRHPRFPSSRCTNTGNLDAEVRSPRLHSTSVVDRWLAQLTMVERQNKQHTEYSSLSNSITALGPLGSNTKSCSGWMPSSPVTQTPFKSLTSPSLSRSPAVLGATDSPCRLIRSSSIFCSLRCYRQSGPDPCLGSSFYFLRSWSSFNYDTHSNTTLGPLPTCTITGHTSRDHTFLPPRFTVPNRIS